MNRRRHVSPLLLLSATLALSGCAKDLNTQLQDAAVRKQVIDSLVGSPTTRGEVIDRLFSAPADRAAVVERILKDDAAKGDLLQAIIADDRGKALIVGKITADDATAKTFIRMLMLTGVMGATLSQPQAEMLGFGDAFALGNRRRTVADLRKFGRVVDDVIKKDGGKVPECQDLSNVQSCLVKKLPPESIAGLRLDDAWGRPFAYRSYRDGTGYALLSYATDGFYDGTGNTGPTGSLDCDIVFSNGAFVQWPGSMRKEELQ